MTNPLHDALFAPLQDRDDPLLLLHNAPPISGRDFTALTRRIAQTLQAQGLRPGDRLALQADKSPEALAVYAATILSGAVFLPLNPAYTVDEIDYFLSDATPRLFVCDPRRAMALSAVASRHGATLLSLGAQGDGSLLDAARGQTGKILPTSRTPESLAAILYTSGTTGRSKGAMLSHENLLSNARTLAGLWRFTPEDTLLHALPIFHTHGLFVASNTALLTGGRMIFLPSFNAETVLAEMPRATVMMGVPTFYTRLLDAPTLPQAAKGMRLFISGSAPLLAETHVQWQARTGHRILERYGMTETNMNTSNPYEGERRAGSVGLPLPGVELRLVADGQEVATGEVGVIEVRGPNVFQGYWQMPEKTAQELRPDGWFITGDLATRDAEGYVTIVGRAKDLIISGGFNVYPKEVELLLDDVEGVAESAVIGLPHPDFGEAVFAVLTPAKGATLDPAMVLGAISGKLARFKQPKAAVVLPELPRNTMGKVQKAMLRQTYATWFQPAKTGA